MSCSAVDLLIAERSIAVASQAWHFWLLYGFYGVYYGFIEGEIRADVADLAPDASWRGTAYCAYSGRIGPMLLPASLLTGIQIWYRRLVRLYPSSILTVWWLAGIAVSAAVVVLGQVSN